MIKHIKKLCIFGLSAFCVLAQPRSVQASSHLFEEIKVEMTSNYMIKIDGDSVPLHKVANIGSSIVGEVAQGEVYEVLDYKNDWVKINNGGDEGYLELSNQTTLIETTTQTVDPTAVVREEVVEYAVQFIGNPYSYGGSDPNSGVDCSGFTSYVMRNAASLSIPHSSSGQANYGVAVGFEKMKPGDLIFYSGGSQINHVAMYIGQGQVVHASTERSGIKISPWNYRTPVKAVDVLSIR